jgi:hypothetical protein
MAAEFEHTGQEIKCCTSLYNKCKEDSISICCYVVISMEQFSCSYTDDSFRLEKVPPEG